MQKYQIDHFVSVYKEGRFNDFIASIPEHNLDDLIDGVRQAIEKQGRHDGKNSDLDEMWVSLVHESMERDRLEETSGKIRIIPWKEFVGQSFEEPKWVIENVLPEKGILAVAGAPESYKSFFVDYLAIKIALGEPLLDKFDTNKTRVLIIDLENIKSWVHKRLIQLSSDKDIPIYFLDRESITADLLEGSVLDQILAFVGENNIGLVIIDTLRMAHPREENSSTDMKPVIDALKLIASKAAVLFIHHHRKSDKFGRGRTNGEDMMGSILIRGAVDYQLTLTNLGQQPDGAVKIRVAQTKSRYTRAIKTFEMALEEADSLLTFVYKGESEDEKLKRDEAKEAILELLAEQECKRKEIIDQLVSAGICGSRTVEGALKDLIDEERIEHTSSKPHIYSLAKTTENVPQTAITNSDYGITESTADSGAKGNSL